MPNISYQYLYRSPFNFLDPYTKDDEHIFFGRDEEIDDVYLLFEKTNLVVIYGPSGSGKSSLAQCGLVNRFFDWQPIEIRRNLNIVDSFFDAIEIETDENGEIIKGLFDTEGCKKLRNIFDRLTSTRNETSFNPIREENLDELREIIEELYLDLTVIPFFIFDQFEELFIENQDTSEIENFSILLSLITKRVSLSNVVICIQTEFFSNLVKLEDYNPNILNYKCEIKDPNEDNIKKIIRGTFEKFNINQVRDDTGEKISELEKEERIEELVIRIRNVGSHLPFVQIYLDKLYVLDFEKTYEREKDLLKNPDRINPEAYPLEFKVEEIKAYGQIDEILENYIDKVNTAVIARNNKIGSKGNEHAVIKFLKHFMTQNDTRRAIAVESRSRSANAEEKYYSILDKRRSKIIQSIWGKEIDDVDETLGDIIDELLKARIIKYQNGVIEFSHNFLVRVVKRISVDEDILEYYKRQFNSAFDTYIISDESKKELLSSGQVKNLKSRIYEILNKKDSLLNIESHSYDNKLTANKIEEYQKKEEFWRKSKNLALWRNVLWIGSYVLIGVVAIVIATNEINKNELESEIERNELLKKQAAIDNKRMAIHDTITEAADLGIYDLTQSFKLLESLPQDLKDNELSLEEFDLGLKIRNDLIKDFLVLPFYKKKIHLPNKGKRSHVISTKSRKLSNDEFLLFALTTSGLFSKKIKTDNKPVSNNWHEVFTPDNKITAYEPYQDDNGNIRVLYSNKEGLFDSNWRFEDSDNKLMSSEDEVKNIKVIDYLGHRSSNPKEEFFVGIDENGKKILNINLHKLKQKAHNPIGIFKTPEYLKRENNEIHVLNTIDRQAHVVSYVCNKGDSLIIVYKHPLRRSNIVSSDSIVIHKDDQFNKITLGSFKIDANLEQILFEDNRKVYSIPFKAFLEPTRAKIQTKVVSFHQLKINSIDNTEENKKHYALLGSSDKTASLFFDPNTEIESDEVLVKTFKGHTDAIHNVSFLGSDHIITSSEDGTICLWDISEPAVNSITRPDQGVAPRLKFNNDKLYVGFQRKPYKSGYLLELTETRGNKSFDTRELAKVRDYDSNSFDFYKEDIYIGSRFGNRISKLDRNNRLTLWDTVPQSGRNTHIFDLKIRGSKMVVMTKREVNYYPNLEGSKQSFHKKISQNKYSLMAADVHPYKELVVICSDDSNLYLWDVKKDTVSINNTHVDRVRDVRFSDDGEYMVSASWDNKAIIWKVKDDNTIEEIDTILHNSDVATIAMKKTNDNQLIIATGSSDKTVILNGIDLDAEKPYVYRIPSIIHHDFAIRSLVFGNDASAIYSMDSRGFIKKWEWKTFMEVIEERTSK